jgi:hypothetical protein
MVLFHVNLPGGRDDLDLVLETNTEVPAHAQAQGGEPLIHDMEARRLKRFYRLG